MRTLKLGVCFLDEEDKVISKKVIGTNWSVDIEQDFRVKPNVHMINEIAEIMTENIKVQLEPDTIKQMLSDIEERT